jgi:hypothetical protein
MEDQFLRILLVIYMLGAFGLAIAYLRYRRCSAFEFVLWGILAFILPVIGPFFVIAARPGPRKRFKQPGLAGRVITSPKG